MSTRPAEHQRDNANTAAPKNIVTINDAVVLIW